MIVSHKYKALYIATPKTGSTSIREALKPYFEVTPKTFSKLGIPEFEEHLMPRDAKKYFDQQNWDWDSYFKFTFVRNPWAVHLSRWNYRLKLFNGDKEYPLSHGQYGWYKKEVSKYINKYKNFENWTINADHSFPWYHYKNWTYDLDFIGKTESSQKDIDYVSKKIGLPRIKLPHRNKSTSAHYSTYYNETTKNIVAEAYAKDIEYFGYEFGE